MEYISALKAYVWHVSGQIKFFDFKDLKNGPEGGGKIYWYLVL